MEAGEEEKGQKNDFRAPETKGKSNQESMEEKEERVWVAATRKNVKDKRDWITMGETIIRREWCGAAALL